MDFDQLSGAACTWKLVKIHNTGHYNIEDYGTYLLVNTILKIMEHLQVLYTHLELTRESGDIYSRTEQVLKSVTQIRRKKIFEEYFV